METIVLGGGCFWCTEAAIQLIPGVLSVEPGYAGGSRQNPSYDQVCSGLTGHAEVVRVGYNPAILSLKRLLELFLQVHDPTTEDRQGADIGSQYRSIILFTDETQATIARAVLGEQAGRFSRPIVTELEPLGEFWPAEAEHRDFYRRNPGQGYCRIVIKPKLDSLRLELGPAISP